MEKNSCYLNFLEILSGLLGLSPEKTDYFLYRFCLENKDLSHNELINKKSDYDNKEHQSTVYSRLKLGLNISPTNDKITHREIADTLEKIFNNYKLSFEDYLYLVSFELKLSSTQEDLFLVRAAGEKLKTLRQSALILDITPRSAEKTSGDINIAIKNSKYKEFRILDENFKFITINEPFLEFLKSEHKKLEKEFEEIIPASDNNCKSLSDLISQNAKFKVKKVNSFNCIKKINSLENNEYKRYSSFKEYIFDLKTLQEWWESYPDGIRVLYKGENIVGAVGLSPISEQQSAALEAGEILERELKIEKVATNIWYVGAIVIQYDIRIMYQREKPSFILLRDAIGEWISNFDTYPHTILALAYSKAGKNKLKKYGFREYKNAEIVKDKVPLYRLRIENESGLNKIKPQLPVSSQ